MDPLVLAQSLSVLFKEEVGVGAKEQHVHLFKVPSTCKFTSRQHLPVSERPINERSPSSTYYACSTFHTKLLCNVNSPQSQVFAPPTDTTCFFFFVSFQNNRQAPQSFGSLKLDGDLWSFSE